MVDDFIAEFNEGRNGDAEAVWNNDMLLGAWLFGSWVMGDEYPGSDVEKLIAWAKKRLQDERSPAGY